MLSTTAPEPSVQARDSRVCTVCRRSYAHADYATTCSDWDKVLGPDRHNWKITVKDIS